MRILAIGLAAAAVLTALPARAQSPAPAICSSNDKS